MTSLQIVPKSPAKQYASDLPVHSTRLDYADATGEYLAGVMLSQIVWLYQKGTDGKPKKDLILCSDGMFWVPRTYDQWALDMHLSAKQVRRLLNKLEDLGFIAKVARLHERDKVTHIRLLCAKGTASLAGYPRFPTGQGTLPPKADPSAPQGKPLKALEIKDKEIKIETPGQVPDTTGEQTETKEPGEPDMGNAIENLKFSQGRKYEIHPAKIGAGYLAIQWKKYYASRYPGPMSGHLVKTEQGKLGLFLKAVGELRAESSMAWAIENWVDFMLKVKSDCGVSTVPLRPDPGWMLKYCDVLLQLIAKNPAPEPDCVSPKDSKAFIIPVAPAKEEVQIASEADILAELAKYQGKE
jgi:hypothetical protein